jgi:dTDP-4-dehydrorhamnose reductase
MLGKELCSLFFERSVQYIATDCDVDITDKSAVFDFAQKQNILHGIDWIINCAAYTAVDRAEENPETCRKVNVTGSANIAEAAHSIGARLIHISTDYVFDGKGITPYKEDDKTDPLGVYGLTKRESERMALTLNKDSLIIRTSWLYGLYGKNFVSTMLNLMTEKKTVSVVNDKKGNPTWARDLAETIFGSICCFEKLPTPEFGIYHYTNTGNISWYDFALEIYKKSREIGLLQKDCEVRPCSSAEFPAKARRPAYSVLDTTKITQNFNIPIKKWEESLESFLKLCAN